MHKKDRIITGLIILIVCLLISIFYSYSFNVVGNIYQDETQNTIINIKKSFLKNTVDNLIMEIELIQNNEAETYKKYVIRRYETLILENHLTDNEFVEYFIERFNLDINKDSYLDYWTVLLWDKTSNQILYDPGHLVNGDVNEVLTSLKANMSYYKTLDYGNLSGFLGVSQDFINNRIKAITADKIRKSKFDNGSYIWVNEVINYDGGKNYAIRRVHPNLIETEGMYLSTDITDVKGNLPYLEELEGVKKYGEIFFKYYFKELDSDNISEKLSFVKLYKDFDWIIGMGVHTDDIQQLILSTNEKSNELAIKYMNVFLLIILIIIFLNLGLLIFIKNENFKKEKSKIELENKNDLLTNTLNRKYGSRELIKSFNEFKNNSTSPAIMMFDIDQFKYINDTFGHNVGDKVLQGVVNTVNKTIRSTDNLIRWGGDEFVGICYGLNEDNVLAFGEKVLSAVAAMNISSADIPLKVTISIGFSYLEENDKDICDVIKRADMAMYKSKEEGKNAVNIL